MKTIAQYTTGISQRIILGLAIQQFFYGMKYNQWMDFSTFSLTGLILEFLFIAYLVSSSIVYTAKVRALEPMQTNNYRNRNRVVPDNEYKPNN